jgi:hypothetical protein
LTENFDPPAGEREESENGFDQGGFSGTIRSEDSDESSCRNGEINSVDDRSIMISDGQIMDFQRWR